MKKIFKILLTFLLLVTVKIKADYNAIGLNVDYTTVYPGDVIHASLGYDTKWDEGVADLYYDDTLEEYTPNIINGRYQLETIYLKYNKYVFSLNDVSEFKLVNDNYVLESYDSYEDEEDWEYEVYEFHLSAKEIENEEEDYPMYDGIMDNIIFDNLQFKVSKDTLKGTYEIYTKHASEEDSEDRKYREILPITVVNEKSKKGLEKLNVTAYNDITEKEETKKMDLEEDVYKYMLNIPKLGYNDIEYIQANCYKKCHVSNLGSISYVDDNEVIKNETLTLTVKYEDGETLKYVIESAFKNKTIDGINSGQYILAITPKSNNEYLNKIKKLKVNDYIDVYTYSFDKINDTDIKLLEETTNQKFDDRTKTYTFFKDSDITITTEEGTTTKQTNDFYDKELTDEEIQKEFEKIFGECDKNSCTNVVVKEENEETTSRELTREKTVVEEIDEQIKTKISPVYYGLIAGVLIIIFIIIIVKEEKNKKKKKEETTVTEEPNSKVETTPEVTEETIPEVENTNNESNDIKSN